VNSAHPRRVVRPRSVEEVATVLADHPDIPVFAGGTLAVPDWQRRGAPEVVMYLGGVAELRHAGPACCGALTTLAELAQDDRAPTALRQAAGSVGGPAVRAMATMGGNVVAARPGCVATALLAVGAVAHGLLRHSPREETTSRLQDMFLAQQTLLLAARWGVGGEQQSAFAKVAVRAAGGPNVVSAAVCRDAAACAVAIGAPGSLPHRLTVTESRWRDGASAAEVAGAAADEVVVVDDITATARYRRAVVRTLVRRLVTEIEGCR
jgi:CO/xanthine dehydrogenase FAD-binding subunit